MSTHNRYIYHCLKCGSISIKEPWEDGPQCCGVPMNQSAAETVEDSPETPGASAPCPPADKSAPPAPLADLSVWFD
ncbi:MAG: hypothetical protein ACK5TO_15285 [Planctomycetaceae bacterium]|jgi:hypothetical protein